MLHASELNPVVTFHTHLNVKTPHIYQSMPVGADVFLFHRVGKGTCRRATRLQRAITLSPRQPACSTGSKFSVVKLH